MPQLFGDAGGQSVVVRQPGDATGEREAWLAGEVAVDRTGLAEVVGGEAAESEEEAVGAGVPVERGAPAVGDVVGRADERDRSGAFGEGAAGRP